MTSSSVTTETSWTCSMLIKRLDIAHIAVEWTCSMLIKKSNGTHCCGVDMFYVDQEIEWHTLLWSGHVLC